MYVSFEEIADTARVWIYQSNRPFSANECEIMNDKLIEFINNWKRHGADLKGSFLIKYNQFIILTVDETFQEISGCSIDASVNLIKQFEKSFKIDLTNKLNVSFKDGENINIISLADFKKFAQQQKITSNTIVFNNMVTSKEDFLNNWEIEAGKSWHQRFLA